MVSDEETDRCIQEAVKALFPPILIAEYLDAASGYARRRNQPLLHSDWPSYLTRHADVVRAIYIGHCPDPDHIWQGEFAHAHTREGAEHYPGTICFLAKELMVEGVALHEIAHLIANAGHNSKWRRTVLKIGGTLDRVVIPGVGVMKSYRKVIKRYADERDRRYRLRQQPPFEGK